jgi:DNA polymerase
MPTLIRDYETRSALDLPEVGAWRYMTDPSTDVWCCAYCVENGEIKLWKRGDPTPDEFIEAARDPTWIVAAFNDGFDRLVEQHIMGPRYGWPLVPIERHRCLQAATLALALPPDLKTVAKVLGLANQKDELGAEIMRELARPRPPRAGEDRSILHWCEDPEKLAILHEYAIKDTAAERELAQRIPALIPQEQAIWELDARVNSRGLMVDGDLLAPALRIAEAERRDIDTELTIITDGDVRAATERDRIVDWLGAHGAPVVDCKKGTLRHALRRKALPPLARKVIELRLAGAHAAADKLLTMQAWRAPADSRVRGAFRYHGASTGRWTSFGVQLQNLKKAESEDMTTAIAAVATGNIEMVRPLGPPMSVVGSITRGLITAAPGHRFIAGDFSGIESRVTAAVSGQPSKLAQWAKFDETQNPQDEPYYILGRQLGFEGAQARALGKTADLAFGYMGSIGAWRKLAPDDDTSTNEQIRRYRDAWRRAHPQTARYWRMLDGVALYAMRNPGQTFEARRVAFTYDGKEFLRMRLPSGREIAYPYPRIIASKFGNPAVSFMDWFQGQWVECRFGAGAYGGLWIENAVQAISRDLLAEAMIRLEARGYPIVLHVHDEIVAEVPEGFGSVEEFQQIITTLPSWATGLPIACKCRNGPRFAKTSKSAAAATPDAGMPWSDRLDDIHPDGLKEKLWACWRCNQLNEWLATKCCRCGQPMRKEAASNGTVNTPEIPEIATTIGTAESTESADEPEDAEPEDAEPEDDEPEDDEPEDDEPEDAPPADENEHAQEADQQNGGRDDRRDADGYPHGERNTGHQVTFFIYRHADNQPYLGVKKTSTKQFPQYHAENGRWVKGPPKGPKIPYRLPELTRTPLDAWIVVAAGEKDAETAAALGFVGTTNPEGERKGAWAPELNAWFHGRRVAIMEDNDETGRAHVIEVAEQLRGKASDIRIVTFRDLPAHGDLTDWAHAKPGRGYKELLAKIEEAAPYYRKPSPAPIRQWDGMPVPELLYAVPDRFPSENVGLFSGEGGQGKSSLVQQLCVAHTIAGEWLGCTPRQGPAIYIECEDAERVLHWRLMAIAGHYGVSLTAIADARFHMFPLADEENTILATAPDKSGIIRPTPLYDWLYELAGDIKPVMIGIASSANVFAGNENVRTEVQQFIRLLRRIAYVAGGTVLLVTQPSISGIDHKSASHAGLSGTTQWHNAVRARAAMTSVKPEDGIDTGLRQIKFHKNQYGPASSACFVRYNDGLFLPVEGMSMDEAERTTKADEIFVALLRRFTEQNRKLSAKVNPSNYAPSVFARLPEAEGFSRKELALAMERLLNAGIVENRTFNKGQEERSYLALAGT